MTKVRLVLVLPLFLSLASGCGPRNPNAPARVSGKVTYNGQPLKGGAVTFHSTDKGFVAAPIQLDGTYSATDLPAGELVVTVETETVNPNKKAPGGDGVQSKQMQKMMNDYKNSMPQAPPDAQDPAAYVKIPAKYADSTKSGLTVTLAIGKNTKDFNLTD